MTRDFAGSVCVCVCLERFIWTFVDVILDRKTTLLSQVAMYSCLGTEWDGSQGLQGPRPLIIISQPVSPLLQANDHMNWSAAGTASMF